MEEYLDRARQLAPHYLAIVLLIIVALSVTEAVYAELTGVMRLLLAVGVAIAYPIVLRRLDLAPEPWS